VIKKLNGEIDGDKAMAAFKGLAFDTPRGKISIDPDTREVVQPIYVFQIERRGDGELVNKLVYTFPDVYNHMNK